MLSEKWEQGIHLLLSYCVVHAPGQVRTLNQFVEWIWKHGFLMNYLKLPFFVTYAESIRALKTGLLTFSTFHFLSEPVYCFLASPPPI